MPLEVTEDHTRVQEHLPQHSQQIPRAIGNPLLRYLFTGGWGPSLHGPRTPLEEAGSPHTWSPDSQAGPQHRAQPTNTYSNVHLLQPTRSFRSEIHGRDADRHVMRRQFFFHVAKTTFNVCESQASGGSLQQPESPAGTA